MDCLNQTCIFTTVVGMYQVSLTPHTWEVITESKESFIYYGYDERVPVGLGQPVVVYATSEDTSRHIAPIGDIAKVFPGNHALYLAAAAWGNSNMRTVSNALHLDYGAKGMLDLSKLVN